MEWFVQSNKSLITLTELKGESWGTRYAARIAPLGLTGYGDSPQEAKNKVRQMLVSDILAHQMVGTLEEWLDRLFSAPGR